MKMAIYFIVLCAIYVTSALRCAAQGYIVPNGVTYAGNMGPLGSEFHVIQNPTNGDYTGFNLTPQGSDTFLFNPFLDEGVRTFLVSSNDPVSLQAVLGNGYTELTYPNTYNFPQDTPFYVGLYTGYNPVDGIYSNPLFGWAEMENVSGVVQLIDGALEIQGGGIYAGTENIIPVPEPTAIALLAAGGLIVRRCPWRLHAAKGVE